MATIVINGESIEGIKVTGNSRKPLDYKGITIENGKRLHKFISRFNTKSSIIEEIGETDKIISTAYTSLEDEIICDDALLRSVDKRFSTEHESNASAKHGTTTWSFTRQTNVMITRSHQEIVNALRKRELRDQENKMITD
jgi:hypothetical protein